MKLRPIPAEQLARTPLPKKAGYLLDCFIPAATTTVFKCEKGVHFLEFAGLLAGSISFGLPFGTFKAVGSHPTLLLSGVEDVRNYGVLHRAVVDAIQERQGSLRQRLTPSRFEIAQQAAGADAFWAAASKRSKDEQNAWKDVERSADFFDFSREEDRQHLIADAAQTLQRGAIVIPELNRWVLPGADLAFLEDFFAALNEAQAAVILFQGGDPETIDLKTHVPASANVIELKLGTCAQPTVHGGTFELVHKKTGIEDQYPSRLQFWYAYDMLCDFDDLLSLDYGFDLVDASTSVDQPTMEKMSRERILAALAMAGDGVELKGLAEHFGMSPSHVSRVLKKHIGGLREYQRTLKSRAVRNARPINSIPSTSSHENDEQD